MQLTLLILAGVLILVATLSQGVRRFPVWFIVAIHCVTVPIGTFAVAYVVTEDSVFSGVFALILSIAGVSVVAWALTIRNRRENTRQFRG